MKTKLLGLLKCKWWSKVSGDPINIPERLGPNKEDAEPGSAVKEKENLAKFDLSGLAKTIEKSEGKVGIRKDPN